MITYLSDRSDFMKVYDIQNETDFLYYYIETSKNTNIDYDKLASIVGVEKPSTTDIDTLLEGNDDIENFKSAHPVLSHASHRTLMDKFSHFQEIRKTLDLEDDMGHLAVRNTETETIDKDSFKKYINASAEERERLVELANVTPNTPESIAISDGVRYTELLTKSIELEPLKESLNPDHFNDIAEYLQAEKDMDELESTYGTTLRTEVVDELETEDGFLTAITNLTQNDMKL